MFCQREESIPFRARIYTWPSMRMDLTPVCARQTLANNNVRAQIAMIVGGGFRAKAVKERIEVGRGRLLSFKHVLTAISYITNSNFRRFIGIKKCRCRYFVPSAFTEIPIFYIGVVECRLLKAEVCTSQV